MRGSCPVCGALFEAWNPRALVTLVLEHDCRELGYVPEVDQ